MIVLHQQSPAKKVNLYHVVAINIHIVIINILMPHHPRNISRKKRKRKRNTQKVMIVRRKNLINDHVKKVRMMKDVEIVKRRNVMKTKTNMIEVENTIVIKTLNTKQ